MQFPQLSCKTLGTIPTSGEGTPFLLIVLRQNLGFGAVEKNRLSVVFFYILSLEYKKHPITYISNIRVRDKQIDAVPKYEIPKAKETSIHPIFHSLIKSMQK